MADPIVVGISDLSEKGLSWCVSRLTGDRAFPLDDWGYYGPLLHRYGIELQYIAPGGEHDARRILGWRDEPWTASFDGPSGPVSESGTTPTEAIARAFVAGSLPGVEVPVPVDLAPLLLRSGTYD